MDDVNSHRCRDARTSVTVATTVTSEACVIGSGRGVLRPSTRTDDGKQVLKCISMTSLITLVR